ncbi:MAG: hypothetical protein ACLQM8_08370, partial [Limisphaerales bacterium]
MRTGNKTTDALNPPWPAPGWAWLARTPSRRKAPERLNTPAAVARSSARAVLVLAAAALAAFGPALGARAQGSIDVDNSLSTGRVCIGYPGNYYGGVYGVLVFMLNVPAVPLGINDNPNPFNALDALGVDGFNLEATFFNENMASTPGIVQLGEVDMPDVTPAGARVVIALAIWDSATFHDPATALGVVAFMNPTADYTASPPLGPPPLSGWTSDLVMFSPIPEPSTSALAALGVALWLLLRRH